MSALRLVSEKSARTMCINSSLVKSTRAPDSSKKLMSANEASYTHARVRARVKVRFVNGCIHPLMSLPEFLSHNNTVTSLAQMRQYWNSAKGRLIGQQRPNVKHDELLTWDVNSSSNGFSTSHTNFSFSDWSAVISGSAIIIRTTVATTVSTRRPTLSRHLD